MRTLVVIGSRRREFRGKGPELATSSTRPSEGKGCTFPH